MSGSTASGSPLDLRAAPRRLRELVAGVCFWTAIVLPFLYLPSVVLGELVPVPVWLVAGAVVVNIVALLLGHRYEPRSPRT